MLFGWHLIVPVCANYFDAIYTHMYVPNSTLVCLCDSAPLLKRFFTSMFVNVCTMVQVTLPLHIRVYACQPHPQQAQRVNGCLGASV